MALDAATMDRRFREMDRQGIDVHVISVHPSQFLYFTEPGLAARIVKMQNEKIAELVAAHRDRFVGFGNVSLQQPDLAVEQLEYAVKMLDLRGFIVGANVNGGELANPKLDPFWKKVEELQTVVMSRAITWWSRAKAGATWSKVCACRAIPWSRIIGGFSGLPQSR